MAVETLTDKQLKALKPRDKQYEVQDAMVRGLSLRVMPTGSKRWSVRYRVGRGYRRIALGQYPKPVSLKAARDLATDKLLEIRKGRDPSAERRAGRTDATVRELFEDCVERHWKKKARTWQDIQGKLENNIPRHWWTRSARSITTFEVQTLIDEIVEDGHPAKADTIHAYLGVMFRHGKTRNMADENPVADVPKPYGQQVREADPLTAAQVRKLWSVLTTQHPTVASFYRLRLLTLQRGQQVRLMKWADLETTEDGRVGEWWNAPGTSRKNKRPDRVYLNTTARREIERLRRWTGDSQWVLRSPAKREDTHIGLLQTPSLRIREAAGLPKDWARNFRLTGATWLTENGISAFDVGRVLGHKEPGVIRHYDRNKYDPQKREALKLWGDRVLEILLRRRPEEGKVVSMEGRR